MMTILYDEDAIATVGEEIQAIYLQHNNENQQLSLHTNNAGNTFATVNSHSLELILNHPCFSLSIHTTSNPSCIIVM